MGKRSEYRRMMRALQDLDRVDAGKAPKRDLHPEVRSATDRWVHGNTAKVASEYAKAGGPVALPRKKPRGWLIALIVVLAVLGAIAAIPASRHTAVRVWKDATQQPGRVLPPVAVTTHGKHAFERTVGVDHHEPATYNPCQVIRYTVNSDLAPAGSGPIIPAAVSEVSRLTGLKFEYAGVSHAAVHYTKQADRSVMLGDYPPVEIAWSSPSEFATLKGDVLGFGGSTFLRTDSGDIGYVTGSVSLRADELGRALRQPGGQAFVKAVVLHELGHVVGLAHVNDPHELMNPVISKQRDFGPGDREGLALVGQGACSRGL